VHIEASTIVPNIVVGCVAILLGLFAFRFRRQIRDLTIWGERRALGDTAADKLAKTQTPFWTGFAGIWVVVLGLTMITYGVVGIIQNN
jgi:hypothetical protein